VEGHFTELTICTAWDKQRRLWDSYNCYCPVQKPDDILVIHSILTLYVPNAPPPPNPTTNPQSGTQATVRRVHTQRYIAQ
jgi:hypothetical protein